MRSFGEDFSAVGFFNRPRTTLDQPKALKFCARVWMRFLASESNMSRNATWWRSVVVCQTGSQTFVFTSVLPQKFYTKRSLTRFGSDIPSQIVRQLKPYIVLDCNDFELIWLCTTIDVTLFSFVKSSELTIYSNVCSGSPRKVDDEQTGR